MHLPVVGWHRGLLYTLQGTSPRLPLVCEAHLGWRLYVFQSTFKYALPHAITTMHSFAKYLLLTVLGTIEATKITNISAMIKPIF